MPTNEPLVLVIEDETPIRRFLRASLAEEAYRVGFVDEVVAPDKLQETAMALATTISEKAPLGLRLGKQAMNEAEYLPVEEGYAREQTYSTRLMQTEDAREATRAVVEKRAPLFQGR